MGKQKKEEFSYSFFCWKHRTWNCRVTTNSKNTHTQKTWNSLNRLLFLEIPYYGETSCFPILFFFSFHQVHKPSIFVLFCFGTFDNFLYQYLNHLVTCELILLFQTFKYIIIVKNISKYKCFFFWTTTKLWVDQWSLKVGHRCCWSPVCSSQLLLIRLSSACSDGAQKCRAGSQHSQLTFCDFVLGGNHGAVRVRTVQGVSLPNEKTHVLQVAFILKGNVEDDTKKQKQNKSSFIGCRQS